MKLVHLIPKSLRARIPQTGKDSTLASIVELLTVTVSLVSFYLLARSLGKAAYGEFGAMYAVVAPLSTLIGVGPSLAFLQVGLREGSDRTAALARALGTHAVLFVPATLVALLVLLPTTSIPIGSLIALLGAELGTNALVAIFASAMQVSAGLRAKLAIQGTAVVGRLLLIVTLALTDNLNIGAYFVGLLCVSLSVLAVAVTKVRRQRIPLKVGLPRGHFLQSSIGFSVSLFFLGLQSDMDKFLLVAFNESAAAGGYTAAYRIVAIALVPISALVTATQKQFMNVTSSEEVIRLTVKFSRYALLYSVVAVMGLFVVAPFVDDVLGVEYSDVPRNILYLCPLVVGRSVSSFPLNGMLALDEVFSRTALIVFAAVASLLMYVILIPPYGVVGASIGTALSELTLGLGAWLLLRRQIRSRSGPPGPGAMKAAEE